MLPHGLKLCVVVDGHALDYDQDYFLELRLAWTLANRPGAAAPTIRADQILHMGTRGGSTITFGENAPLGVLKPGALADLVLLDWAGVQGVWASPEIPTLDLLLRRSASKHVVHVLVNGEWVVRNGKSTRVDEQAVIAAIRDNLNRYDPTVLAQNSAAAKALAPYLRRFYASWDTDVAAPGRFYT
jgi:cytosine/adenosine deaminase-related metal-dependent hydrolase